MIRYVISIWVVSVGLIEAQAQTDRPEFSVASIKQNKSDGESISNFPLGPGDVYVPNGGLFSAIRFPLITYIAFAYKLTNNDLPALRSQLPPWVTEDRFDIQARAEGNPGKDQMRLMMRSLLMDRFRLATHYETREIPALALVQSKLQKTGTQLRAHTGDESCPTEASADSARAPAQTQTLNQALANGLPTLCGGIFDMRGSVPGRRRVAARNVTTTVIANFLSAAGNLGRPVVDHTGFSGTFDFSLEWTWESGRGPEPPEENRITFLQALNDQLGLKLESTKAMFETFVVDHVERPSEN